MKVDVHIGYNRNKKVYVYLTKGKDRIVIGGYSEAYEIILRLWKLLSHLRP
jgi:hypothetical protein